MTAPHPVAEHPLFQAVFDLGQMRGELQFPGGWRWAITGTRDPLDDTGPPRKVQITATLTRAGDAPVPWLGAPGFHHDMTRDDFGPVWIGTLRFGSAVWTGEMVHVGTGWRMAFGDGPEREGMLSLIGTVRERSGQ